jgi:hypothetical protein
MNVRNNIRFFLAATLSMAIVLTIGARQIVQASSFLPNGKLQSSEVINNDVFASGQLVTIDGTVNGDVIIVANQVQINGTVNGSLFIIGQKTVVQGKVSGTAYDIAVSLELLPEAVLGRNLYFLGVSLTTQPGSAIERDLRTICMGADLQGTVAGETKATIGILKVIELVITTLGLEFQLPLSGIQPNSVAALGAGAGLLGTPLALLLANAPSAGGIDAALATAWALNLLRDLGLLLILGAVFYWLFRSPLTRTTQALRLKPLPGLAYGLLALVIVLNISLVGVLVASLLFVIGLFLGSIGFWSFTFAFWALTYSALAFLFAALYFIVAYGSKLVIAYLVGGWLFEKITPKLAVPRFIVLAVGVLIYVLLRSIPMVGWVIGVLVTAWGLGAFWLAYRKAGTTNAAVADEKPAEPVEPVAVPEAVEAAE